MLWLRALCVRGLMFLIQTLSVDIYNPFFGCSLLIQVDSLEGLEEQTGMYSCCLTYMSKLKYKIIQL